jgi:hypothetical protein
MSAVTGDAQILEVENLPKCIPVAQAGYHRKLRSPSKCVVQIDRANPITPTTLVVPPGTVVYVELTDTRQNENVTFTLNAARTPTPDTGAALIKSIIPGLQPITVTESIQPSVRTGGNKYRAPIMVLPDPAKQLSDNIKARQKEIATSTNVVLHSVQSAATVLGCLSVYEVPIPGKESVAAYKVSPDDNPPPTYSCLQQKMIQRAEFAGYAGDAFDLVRRVNALPLRLLDVADLDTVVKNFYLTCMAEFTNMGQDRTDDGQRRCRDFGQILSTNEALLDTAMTDLQKAQDTLIQSVQTLDAWMKSNGGPAKLVYGYTTPSHVNMTITIAGTEVVSKVSSPIAVVTINQSTNAMVVSAGIGFSNLKFNTYTASPEIVNGQPVLDSSGKAITSVVGNATAFSVITPEILLSYRLGFVSHFLWETKHCPNNCSFLISGGVGANLTTKTADFDIGPSFQIGGLLLTPTVHFGRDTRLSDGVAVGQILGSSPPSSLPTTQATVIKWGFVLSYSLPIP